MRKLLLAGLFALLAGPACAQVQLPPINSTNGPTTSAQLKSIITDATGSGALNFGSTSLAVGTTPVSGGTSGQCLTISSGILGSGACGTGGGGSPGGASGAIQYNNAGNFGGITAVNNAVLTTNGTGAASWGTTLPNINLGTPTAITLTNGTNLPISTGVSGLGTNVAFFLITPSSANLRSAVSDETGTGLLYFQNGALGTPSSGTLTNATGLLLSGLTAQAANTLVGNGTGSSASPTALSMPSCSSTNNALQWTSGAGFGCVTISGGSGGGVSSVGLSTPNSSLSLGGTNPVTSSGTISADLNLAHSNIWLAAQSFPANGITLQGSSTGITTFTSANAGPTNFTLTFPAITDTVVTLTAAQTLTNKVLVSADLQTPAAINLANATGSPNLSVVSADRYVVTGNNVNAQTGTTYTVQSSDCGKEIILTNAGSVAVSVNTGLPAGCWANFVQGGAGQVTVGGSATLRASNGLKSRAQYSVLNLMYFGSTDTYVVGGDSTP